MTSFVIVILSGALFDNTAADYCTSTIAVEDENQLESQKIQLLFHSESILDDDRLTVDFPAKYQHH